MNSWGWMFGILFAMDVGAESIDSAFLKLDAGKISYEQVVEIKPADELNDPLLCKRVANKLVHLERIERQLVELRKIVAGRTTSQRHLDEIDVLEQRREQTYGFLAEPAPVMMAQWSLENLSEPTLKILKAEVGRFQLLSYALLWEGTGASFSTPEDHAVILVDTRNRLLTLVLKGNVASYCSRRVTRLSIQL